MKNIYTIKCLKPICAECGDQNNHQVDSMGGWGVVTCQKCDKQYYAILYQVRAKRGHRDSETGVKNYSR